MKRPIFLMIFLLLGMSFLTSEAPAFDITDITVNYGSLDTFDGAADLDLAGDLVYAVNCVKGSTDTYAVNGVTFTPTWDGSGYEGTSGVTLSGGWVWGAHEWSTKPEYGSTTDDDQLELLMNDTNEGHGPTDLSIDMDVVTGNEYQLQLLFSENFNSVESKYGDRCFDVEIEGMLAVETLDTLTVIGAWDPAPTKGAVYTYTFTAADDELNIGLLAEYGAAPTINGMTLELINEVPEPGTWILLLTGVAGLIAMRRRK